jgi:hypothetical protein
MSYGDHVGVGARCGDTVVQMRSIVDAVRRVFAMVVVDLLE